MRELSEKNAELFDADEAIDSSRGAVEGQFAVKSTMAGAVRVMHCRRHEVVPFCSRISVYMQGVQMLPRNWSWPFAFAVSALSVVAVVGCKSVALSGLASSHGKNSQQSHSKTQSDAAAILKVAATFNADMRRLREMAAPRGELVGSGAYSLTVQEQLARFVSTGDPAVRALATRLQPIADDLLQNLGQLLTDVAGQDSLVLDGADATLLFRALAVAFVKEYSLDAKYYLNMRELNLAVVMPQSAVEDVVRQTNNDLWYKTGVRSFPERASAAPAGARMSIRAPIDVEKITALAARALMMLVNLEHQQQKPSSQAAIAALFTTATTPSGESVMQNLLAWKTISDAAVLETKQAVVAALAGVEVLGINQLKATDLGLQYLDRQGLIKVEVRSAAPVRVLYLAKDGGIQLGATAPSPAIAQAREALLTTWQNDPAARAARMDLDTYLSNNVDRLLKALGFPVPLTKDTAWAKTFSFGGQSFDVWVGVRGESDQMFSVSADGSVTTGGLKYPYGFKLDLGSTALPPALASIFGARSITVRSLTRGIPRSAPLPPFESFSAMFFGFDVVDAGGAAFSFGIQAEQGVSHLTIVVPGQTRVDGYVALPGGAANQEFGQKVDDDKAMALLVALLKEEPSWVGANDDVSHNKRLIMNVLGGILSKGDPSVLQAALRAAGR
jgi:hypothetical protein